MLAVYKETRHLLTCSQNEPAKLQAPCKLCFPAYASVPHSRNRGYRCLKNFLWKARFITYKGITLSKHFLLASLWERGPQHSSPVRRQNEVHGLAGSEDENVLSYQFSYPHSVKTNHNSRRPFLAKSSEQHERGRRGEEKRDSPMLHLPQNHSYNLLATRICYQDLSVSEHPFSSCIPLDYYISRCYLVSKAGVALSLLKAGPL